MAPVSARFGALQFETLQELAFRPSPLNVPAIKIPISIDLPSASGEVSLKQGGNQIVLSGRVDQLKLDAILLITTNPGDPWSVIVEPNNFAFSASALVSVTPLVYAGRTEFAGVVV